jgi:hypothetical protein
VSVAALIADQKTGHDVPHAVACRALGVSQSWFYKWKRRIGIQTPTGRERRRPGWTLRSAGPSRRPAAPTGLRGSPMTCAKRAGECRRTPWRRGWPSSTWPGGPVRAGAGR